MQKLLQFTIVFLFYIDYCPFLLCIEYCLVHIISMMMANKYWSAFFSIMYAIYTDLMQGLFFFSRFRNTLIAICRNRSSRNPVILKRSPNSLVFLLIRPFQYTFHFQCLLYNLIICFVTLCYLWIKLMMMVSTFNNNSCDILPYGQFWILYNSERLIHVS